MPIGGDWCKYNAIDLGWSRAQQRVAWSCVASVAIHGDLDAKARGDSRRLSRRCTHASTNSTSYPSLSH